MDIIKNYKKFKSYKTVFAVFLATVMISLAMGVTISRTQPKAQDLGAVLWESTTNLRLSLFFEICFLIAVFTAGPTIYAPVVSFLAMVLYGVLWGVRASSIGAFPFLLTVEIIFTSLTAYLMIIYSSFVTLTSMRIFTDTKTNDKNELFNGVMFRAEKFRGIFNLRYILSYVIFFLLFAVFIGLFSVTRTFLLSLTGI